MMNEAISVSEFNAMVNQTLSFAYSEITVEGEVSSFKINQNKWVFFDLKDDASLVGCFIPIFQLNTTLEDGMLIRVKALPQLTKWGKFSLNVREIELSGEGTLKRAFEMLKQKFEKEGLFDESRKRILPDFPNKILLITSRQAAAYNDFITVLDDRFGGIEIDHYQVQVQGEGAVKQLTQAVEYANSHHESYDVIVLIRGGGSIEDLQAFNSQEVVRAIYACQTPTIVGIGHEDDITLAELASDVRAATPTDAARRLAPDKKEVGEFVKRLRGEMEASLAKSISNDRALLNRFQFLIENQLAGLKHNLAELQNQIFFKITALVDSSRKQLSSQQKLLASLNPKSVLARGYSIARVGGKVMKDSADYDGYSPLVLQLNRGSLNLLPENNGESQK